MPPYPARSVPNDMASPTRKTHIPSLPQLSGVRGVSNASACVATASLTVQSPSAPGQMLRHDIWPVSPLGTPVGHKQYPSDRATDEKGHGDQKQDTHVHATRQRIVTAPTDRT